MYEKNKTVKTLRVGWWRGGRWPGGERESQHGVSMAAAASSVDKTPNDRR